MEEENKIEEMEQEVSEEVSETPKEDENPSQE